MDAQPQYQAVHLLVHGYVQGVGFRYYTRAHASRLGIHGWVRNNFDGTVEIEAEASYSRLEAFIAAVRRGPSHGEVHSLDVQWRTETQGFSSFDIVD